MVNADKVIRLGDYVRLERAQKSKDGANFKYDASTGRVTNLAEYFAAHADPNIYTVRFPLWTTSNSTQGVKLDDNAGLSIVPSTNTVSGRDDYRSLPAFRVWDVNGGVDDAGQPFVTAIKDKAGTWSADGSHGDALVMTATGFYRLQLDSQYMTLSYSGVQYDGFVPMPGAMLPDGSLRPCMLFAKYRAWCDGSGIPHSFTGKQTSTAFGSQNGCIDQAAKKGKGWSGKTVADTWYIQLMHMLKYADRNIENTLGGDFGGNGQITISKAEANVTRALVKTTDAQYIDVGSYISVGSGTDRGDPKVGEAASWRKVLSKTVVDSVTTAINVAGSKFTTTTAMHVTQMPWPTGATDGVLGTDGYATDAIPRSHQPIRIQGIEIFTGVYEVESDVILNNVKDSDTAGHTEIWKVFDVTKASKSAITSDYVHLGDFPAVTSDYVHLGDFPAVTDKTNNNWQYAKGFTFSHGMTIPTEWGGTSTSGLSDATLINPISNPGLHELRRGGDLYDGSPCGLFCSPCWNGLADTWWSFGGRLSTLGRTRA